MTGSSPRQEDFCFVNEFACEGKVLFFQIKTRGGFFDRVHDNPLRRDIGWDSTQLHFEV
jgi:hypothetical protein